MPAPTQSHQVSIPLKVCAMTQQVWQQLENAPALDSQGSCSSQVSWYSDNDGMPLSQQSSQSQVSTGPSLAQRRALTKTMSVSVSPVPATASTAPLFPEAPSAVKHSCEDLKASHGWFAKCRGCALLTGQVYTPASCASGKVEVPFCSGCCKQISSAAPEQRQGMEEQLVYIHTSWQRTGL